MATRKQGKSTVADLAEKLAEGTAKHFGSVTKIPLPEGIDSRPRTSRTSSRRS